MTHRIFTTLILESDGYSADALAVYRSLGRMRLWRGLTAVEQRQALGSANVLVVRLGHRITDAWMARMPRLKIIATPTTGLAHIDLEAARKRGIRVISLRGAPFLKTIPSTAEETMGLILALMRRIPWAFEDVKNGYWNRDAWKGNQLRDKTLGILGFGRLGRMVARYARVFGVRVIATDPAVGKNEMARHRVIKKNITSLFKNSDVVSIHASLQQETRDLVRRKHLRMMKPTAYLVNTARAEIVEDGALAKALRKKWIAGAAIDVMRNEDGAGRHLKKDPLWKYAKTHRNLLIVPHLGGATHEAMQATEIWIARYTARFARRISS